MGISDKIEAFIFELLKNEQKNYVELGRNELAQIFNCVPSQINYVLNTRFNIEHGYIVESKRGGNGYLRIYRINADDGFAEILMLLDEPQNYKTCANIIRRLFSGSLISETTAKIMLAAVSPESIPEISFEYNLLRSNILKNMIYQIRKDWYYVRFIFRIF